MPKLGFVLFCSAPTRLPRRLDPRQRVHFVETVILSKIENTVMSLCVFKSPMNSFWYR